MAVIGLCTGTTQDWQDTIGRLILIERELGVEITDDGYYLIRMGNGKDDFFDLPIIVNNKRYEEILSLVSTSYDDVLDMYNKVAQMIVDAEQARDDAKDSADAAKDSEDNAKQSKENAENSALLAQSYAVGGSGLADRVADEDTDNAKYYSEQAKADADRAHAIVGADVMQGATATTDGVGGFVPKPYIADRNKFLKGNGTWSVVNLDEKANGYGITFYVRNGIPFMEYDTDLSDNEMQDIINNIYDDDPTNDAPYDAEAHDIVENVYDGDETNDVAPDALIDEILANIYG